MEEEIVKSKDKLERMLMAIEELQTSDSEHQLVARRAEREAREEREKSLRLERELEGWKGLRLDRNHGGRAGTMAALSEIGEEAETGSRRGGTMVAKSRHSVNFL